MNILIIDGYSKKSRENLQKAGMSFAWQLYARMLKTYMPEAEYTVFHPSDAQAQFPSAEDLILYSGIIWTGADLNINHEHIPSIVSQIELAKTAYEVGIPSFGSCWGIQIAAKAAGGSVEPNPKGREMGIGRKIRLTPEGLDHPMMKGKNPVFDGFESHYDMVFDVPEGGTVLAVNDFTGVQALCVKHKKGTFWGTQYHPEYNLHEMARLSVVREEVLTEHGFFNDHKDFMEFINRWEQLDADPSSTYLRWQLAIDDDILSAGKRQLDFANWIKYLVLPYIQSTEGLK